MQYEIEIRKKAEKDLDSIQNTDAQRIAAAIFLMKDGLVGDIKGLRVFTYRYIHAIMLLPFYKEEAYYDSLQALQFRFGS